MSDDKRFYAYELNRTTAAQMPLSPARGERAWMEETERQYAYRCLPLLIANQAGWLVHCPVGFTAWWDGRELRDGLHLEFDAAPQPIAPGAVGHWPIDSQFGYGIVTFSLPYLFRTPAGLNLWVKGPSNHVKDGVQALEGIVETDWLPAAFTMNWKLTRPNNPVRFEQGEPICMIAPVPRGLAEELEPVRLPLFREPELMREFVTWQKARTEFNDAIRAGLPQAAAGWTKEYFKGVMSTGSRAHEHQTRLHLKDFRAADEPLV